MEEKGHSRKGDMEGELREELEGKRRSEKRKVTL